MVDNGGGLEGDGLGLLSGEAGLGVGLETDAPDEGGVASGVAGGVAVVVEVEGAMPGPNRGCTVGAAAGAKPGAFAQALLCVGQLRVQVPFTIAAYVGWSMT